MKKASVTSADSGFSSSSSGEPSLAASPSTASLRSMRRTSFSSLPSVIKTHYEVCEQIGTGTFGEVLSAFKLPPSTSSDGKESKESKVPVVIRTFREYHKTLDELDLTEIETLSQLSHPNLIRIIDTVWNITNGGVELYLVLQHCDLGDLKTLLENQGPMAEDETLDLLRQVVGGMKELRRHGIIHRDLIPANILIR